MEDFKLWLECELYQEPWDIENEFCNIHVDLPDGTHYGLVVWTFKFFETCINSNKESSNHLTTIYQIPPDLFVKELTRECIEKTISDLLKVDKLERVLNPGILDKRYQQK